MPRRIKRLVFLASFAAVAKQISDTDDDTIRLLNQVLHLATDDKALRLPISVKSVIWKNFDSIEDDVRHLLSRDEDLQQLEQHADHILSCIPAWFVYADRRDMLGDILSLFSITPTQEKQEKAA